jgi:PTS system D-glucosamine-specific IIC component
MNWMGSLQQFGRALMLPMIALPAAAILLCMGELLAETAGLVQPAAILTLSGNAIFANLPFIFAVGVALGLTGNASSAGMSALFSYFILTEMTRLFLGQELPFGNAGGILIGIVTAWAYHKFKHIQLPAYIQFFGGPRFVPLFMSFAAIVIALLIILLEPYLALGLENFSLFWISLGGFGTFLYGVLYRLLVPFGLHYIWNNFFWFQFGSYERADGQVVFGDLPRFFAQDPEAGIYMAGLYPIMMFALPAVALAIIQEARKELKPKVRSTFLAAGLASFLTGVSEPIEFAFLFAAPFLFVIHALLSGTAMWIAYLLEIRHGFSFSAGAIDFFLNAHLAENGWLLIPLGLVYGVIYYVLFRYAIRKFHIPTPGRERNSPIDERSGSLLDRVPLILQALGGKNNIVEIEACITRLRLTLQNYRDMDVAALKHLGAAGVIHLGGGNVQVVFGTFSELIRDEIIKLMKTDYRYIHFQAPVQGKMIPLEEVPDPVFAQKLAGDGVAFIPERGEVVSPVDGTVVLVYPSLHAVGIRTRDGLDVLVHVGIDTVKLDGQWFQAFVSEGDEVAAGQLLIRFPYSKVKKLCKSLATPMVITNPEKVKSWKFAPYKTVKKGQVAVMTVVLQESQTDGGTVHD